MSEMHVVVRHKFVMRSINLVVEGDTRSTHVGEITMTPWPSESRSLDQGLQTYFIHLLTDAILEATLSLRM
jgi:hypothetical protein